MSGTAQLTDLDVWILQELKSSGEGLTVGELHSRAQTLTDPPERPAVALSLEKMRILGITDPGPFIDDRCTSRVWRSIK